jgi:cellulose synthase/poly-beta-1,6-N-acetylglucosamine synthase-like glycosyltransferase
MSYIGPYTKGALDAVVAELDKEENKKKIANGIVSPLTRIVVREIGHYCACFFILQIIIIILLCYMILKINKQ